MRIYKSDMTSAEQNIQSIRIYSNKFYYKDDCQYYRYVGFSFQESDKDT